MAANKGLENLADVLDMIKDPTKYTAKLEELQKATAQYTESVEAVVKLSQVNDYTQSIKEREEESKQVLANAKAEAAALVAKAQADADAVTKKAQEAAQKAAGDVAAAEARMKAVQSLEALVEASKAKLAKAEVEFKIKDKLLSDLGDELTERKNKLLAAMG